MGRFKVTPDGSPPPELDEPRLVWMKFQPEPGKFLIDVDSEITAIDLLRPARPDCNGRR